MTPSATFSLPMKPTTSRGACWAVHSEVSERTASPAPIRSTTRSTKAGTSTKPSGSRYPMLPSLLQVIIICPQASFFDRFRII